MLRLLLSLIFCFTASTFLLAQPAEKAPPSVASVLRGTTAYEGYFDFYWHPEKGKIYLAVDRWDEEFLYVNSLTGGVGSNDIGLDRNQLGSDRIVKFVRTGPQVLLVQPNYQYRAVSDNAEERAAVADAFAQSVIFGFKAVATEGDKVLIDLTPFLQRDAHGVAERLRRNQQGAYKVDKTRCMPNLDRCKSFPKNTEFDALVTFTGDAKGNYIRSVTPDQDIVTVSQHHSFVELPDDNYTPRLFDPRCGYFSFSYYDYATPIDQPLQKRFITRHRLAKKNPTAKVSEAVEPIIYYLDRGTPEPIRSALLEGGRWWNQAFEAAGYRNAFRVEVLPPDADPMDVRYNVINWTHRSTPWLELRQFRGGPAYGGNYQGARTAGEFARASGFFDCPRTRCRLRKGGRSGPASPGNGPGSPPTIVGSRDWSHPRLIA